MASLPCMLLARLNRGLEAAAVVVGQMLNARSVVGSAGWVRAGPSKGEEAALAVRPYGWNKVLTSAG